MIQSHTHSTKGLGRELTACEAEIMKVVWARGSVTVREVCQSITRPLAYTTVMTTMNVLKEKGFITRGGKRGRAFTYYPAISREAAGRDMLDYVAEYYFDGSVEQMVMSLLKLKHG